MHGPETARARCALSSTRARLLVITLAAMVPFAGLVVFNAAMERHTARAHAREQLHGYAQLAARDLEMRVEGTKLMLHALAAASAVRDAAGATCPRFLSNLMQQTDRYNNLLVIDKHGDLTCSAIAPSELVNYADRDWFRQTLASRTAMLSKPLLSRSTGEMIIPIAWPVLDAKDHVLKVVVAGLRLNWLGSQFKRAGVFSELVTLIWDDAGRLLYRSPDNPSQTEDLHADKTLVDAARRADGKGTVDALGSDGLKRIVALSRPRTFREPELTFAFGVPAGTVDAAADHHMWRSLLLLAAIAAGVFAVTWRIAERSVRGPVLRIAEASARLRAGDLGARVTGAIPPGEIGTLMNQFNDTAVALQAQASSLQRTNRLLKALSACNQSLLHAKSEAQLLQVFCDLIVAHGGFHSAWVGYVDDDATRAIRPVAHAGIDVEHVKLLLATHGENGVREALATAIQARKPVVRDDGASSLFVERESTQARAYRLGPSIALPLMVEEQPVGLLNIQAAEHASLDAPEVALISQLATDLAHGIAVLRARCARTRVEAALRESEARLHAAFEYAGDGIAVCNLAGHILHLNRAAIEMHGGSQAGKYPQDMPALATIFELATPDGTLLSIEHWPLARILRGETLRDLELNIRSRRDGWQKVFSYSGTLVRGIDGTPLLAILTVRDITERKRAEVAIREVNAHLERRIVERTAALERANAELAMASDMKSRFLANMSHELRTPLNAIIGFAELMRDGVLGVLNDAQRTAADDIHAAGRHLLAIINDILDLSKVESGAMSLELEPIEIRPIFDASLSMLAEKASQHRLQVRADVVPELPIFSADARKLKQIIYNLLANAVKFTPDDGCIVLAARCIAGSEIHLPEDVPGRLIGRPAHETQQFVEIMVADTGIGISPADLDRVFQPFVQLDNALSRQHQGTGLGLAMVLSLSSLHGGIVGVTSVYSVGTTFYVWLPVSPSPTVTRHAKAFGEDRTAERIDHTSAGTSVLGGFA